MLHVENDKLKLEAEVVCHASICECSFDKHHGGKTGFDNLQYVRENFREQLLEQRSLQ